MTRVRRRVAWLLGALVAAALAIVTAGSRNGACAAPTSVSPDGEWIDCTSSPTVGGVLVGGLLAVGAVYCVYRAILRPGA